MALLSSRLRPLSFALSLALPAAAQCDFTWLPGAAASGPDGQADALLTLPNGDVIAGGSFVLADAAVANNVARWDGTTWQAMGSGLNNTVRALVRLPNGDIVAGGSFTASGATPMLRVARWNGSTWAAMGTGLDGIVNALAVEPNGGVIAGGMFQNAGGVPARLAARWDGVAWSALGTGPATSGEVRAVVRRSNGDLVVGGDLFGVGGSGVRIWDGNTWQNLTGLTATYPSVQRMAQLPNGDLVMRGNFSLTSGFAPLVRWDGATTQPLVPPAFPNTCLFAASNGDVYVGTNNSIPSPDLQRWNGTSWTTVPGGPPRQLAIAEAMTGRLVVSSNSLASPRERTVARYDGANWQTLGGPVPPLVRSLACMPNGDVVVGGQFASFGGVPANNLARWNGTAWSALGAGVDGSVRTVTAAPNGDLVASGDFANAGGAPASRIARWNGQAWSTMGAGLTGEAWALAAGANGEVLAALQPGTANLRRFDGLAWSVLGTGTTGPRITQAVAALPDGSYAIGGVFQLPSSSPTIVSLLRYDAGAIAAFPGWTGNSASRLHVDRLGRLIAAPSFLRYDGTTWTQLPAIGSAALSDLPNGDLIACGNAVSLGGTVSCLFRLRNGAWEALGDVVPTGATAITASDRGEVFAAGTFSSASGLASYAFARAVPTCTASTVVVGAGCVGGAGPVALSTSTGAWAGGVLAATATGMTANSLALQLVGTATPAVALPGGAPGCSLFVAPLLAEGIVPSNGVATTTWTVPNDLALVGVQLRLQVVGVELAGSSIVRLTSTNALQLTIGAL